MQYEWQNIKTGKIVDHDHWSIAPSLPGKWRRVFSVAVGTVNGAAGTPARSSVKHDRNGA